MVGLFDCQVTDGAIPVPVRLDAPVSVSNIL